VDRGHDFRGLLRPDSMDILQRNDDALVGRKVDTSDTSHGFSAPVAGFSGRFPRSRYGENAKCRDDTCPSARAGIVVVLMQNGCRVLKDSKSSRQPLLMTELTRFVSAACPCAARLSWRACGRSSSRPS